MNGQLTKAGKKYFMTLIDDSSRYYYEYFLKSKDEALNYHERKIGGDPLARVGNTNRD
jgi:hypothetical protein